MSRLTRLPAAGHRRMPWRNGLGSTLEIARDTAATAADFGWRVSLADVTRSGAFSPFAGMTRIISVIEGMGMRLHVDGEITPPLGCWQAFVFSGDAQVECELLAGPIRDFNLIYHPDRYAAELDWVSIDGPWELDDSRALLLFCAEGSLEVCHEGAILGLEQLDALHIQPGPVSTKLTIQGKAQLGVVRLRALALQP
ncbi:HutD/Ves family protein [Pseudomonas oryzihabitans]|uniref:HutD/Ves family protein n=1 Tax=Pseudomonas oryzihabitans TaxID=47885 RepID=UPI0028611547|nr:HutD family protein [Pseudomonas psychrotolerans]MDR6676133.1 environmental stress-induced protein Ves [Pseudomonas psychrotolerans]